MEGLSVMFGFAYENMLAAEIHNSSSVELLTCSTMHINIVYISLTTRKKDVPGRGGDVDSKTGLIMMMMILVFGFG